MLDGRASYDPDVGDSISYKWEQIDSSGIEITLLNEDFAVATFNAPLLDQDTTLEFELTVDDGEKDDTDTVNATIIDLPHLSADLPLLPNPFPDENDRFGDAVSETGGGEYVMVGTSLEDLVSFPNINSVFSFSMQNNAAYFTDMNTNEVFTSQNIFDVALSNTTDISSLSIQTSSLQSGIFSLNDIDDNILATVEFDLLSTQSNISADTINDIINDTIIVVHNTVTNATYLFSETTGLFLTQIAQDAGAVYIFDTNGNLVRSIPNPQAGSSDHFGEFLAPVGNGGFVISAPEADVAAVNAGAAYLYNDITDQNPDILTAQSPDTADEFGSAVASDGVIVLVGADEAPNGGTVTIFDVGTGSRLYTMQSLEMTLEIQLQYLTASL